MTKHLQTYGLKRDVAESIVNMNAANHTLIVDGSKVRLNLARLKKHGSWGKTTPKYQDFVHTNRSTVFTAKYENKLICFEEDTTEPKWLFNVQDLDLITDIVRASAGTIESITIAETVV
jgi:hypothetical protein